MLVLRNAGSKAAQGSGRGGAVSFWREEPDFWGHLPIPRILCLGGFGMEKGKSQNQAGIPVGAEHTQGVGLGSEGNPQSCTGCGNWDHWRFLVDCWAFPGREWQKCSLCEQISEAGTEPGTLEPETRNVYGFPKVPVLARPKAGPWRGE